uniref:flavodoxin family protein n=1 Tax=Acetatifactor sp. TaxID=1872090 RepID=UPI0040569F8F
MGKDIIVIYNSQTGFTRKYAQWISEALECECVEFSEANRMNFEQYETIIFGGWACAGGVSKIKWFKHNMKKWDNKKLAVYCVGGSPILSKRNISIIEAIFHNMKFNWKRQCKFTCNCLFLLGCMGTHSVQGFRVVYII